LDIISLQSKTENLSLEELFGVTGAVRNIIVISAYIDTKSIEQLTTFLASNADARTKPTFKIFIDKSSSRFFSNRKAKIELLERQKEILKHFSSDSGIFLVQFGKLFHSKIYLVEGNKNGKLLLGSMNLTQKGINENEEILLVDDFNIGGRAISNKLSKWVKEYSGKLKNKSVSVDDNIKGRYPGCIRQLLLNGSIYYELKEHNPFRFKLNLPEGTIKQQADIDRLLESSVTDTISIETLISEIVDGIGKELPNPKNIKAFWKKYCIETCFGFWNPDSWNEELISTLNSRVEQRKPYYDALLSIIRENSSDIKLSFIDLCERIQAYLHNNKIFDWKYGNIEKAKKAWDQWYDNLLSKLENEKYYNRLISGISSVPSPDVWNDPLSSEEYEDSFFESIIYHWSKEYSRETSNVIAQAISRNIDDYGLSEEDRMDIDILKNAVDSWLAENPKRSIVEFYDND